MVSGVVGAAPETELLYNIFVTNYQLLQNKNSTLINQMTYYPSTHLFIKKLWQITEAIAVPDHKGEPYARPELVGHFIAEDEWGNTFMSRDKIEVDSAEMFCMWLKQFEDGSIGDYVRRDAWTYEFAPGECKITGAPYFDAIVAAAKKEVPYRPWNGFTSEEEDEMDDEEWEKMHDADIVRMKEAGLL